MSVLSFFCNVLVWIGITGMSIEQNKSRSTAPSVLGEKILKIWPDLYLKCLGEGRDFLFFQPLDSRIHFTISYIFYFLIPCCISLAKIFHRTITSRFVSEIGQKLFPCYPNLCRGYSSLKKNVCRVQTILFSDKNLKT